MICFKNKKNKKNIQKNLKNYRELYKLIHNSGHIKFDTT